MTTTKADNLRKNNHWIDDMITAGNQINNIHLHEKAHITNIQNIQSSIRNRHDNFCDNDSNSNMSISTISSYSSQNITKLNNNSKEPGNTSTAHDKIGCVNVQTKYNYNIALDMIIQQDFTLIAFQEPFASNYAGNNSWTSFCEKEAGGIHIQTIHTKFQVVMYDKNIWNNIEMEKVQCYLEGRVITLAFRLNDNYKVGFICVYGVTQSFENSKESQERCELRKKVQKVCTDCHSRWKNKDANMKIVILGDLQDTITTSDRDNKGSFRKTCHEDGVLAQFMESHTSIVRHKNTDEPYWTRYGNKGARGIDHILIPQELEDSPWIKDAFIDIENGLSYFPSDHLLLVMIITRINNTPPPDENEQIKFKYREIFSIKLRQDTATREILGFDDKQFFTEKVKQQEELYESIIALGNDEGSETKQQIDAINEECDQFLELLHTIGMEQKSNGAENKLVMIDTEHAIRISALFEGFEDTLRGAMTQLKLKTVVQRKKACTKGRKQIKKGKGLQPFTSLPASTKLRYLNVRVVRTMNKLKGLQQIIDMFIAEDYSKKDTFQGERMENMKSIHISESIQNIEKNHYLQEMITQINMILQDEEEEWTTHIEAIAYSKKQSKTPRNDKTKDELNINHEKEKSNAQSAKTSNKGNDIIQWVTEEELDAINDVLHMQGVTHKLFKEEIQGNNSSQLNPETTWSQEMESIFSAKIGRIDDTNTQTLEWVNHQLGIAIDQLRKLRGKVWRSQSKYRNGKVTYFAKTNKIGNLIQKIKPLKRDAPKASSLTFDQQINEWRFCHSRKEKAEATAKLHGGWMDNSRAEITCAFASLVEEEGLGVRGVELHPDRKITREDISQLVHKGDKLPENIKQRILKAHGEHTASLFRAPDKPFRDLYYPFYSINTKGDLNNEEYLKHKYLNSIASIPGKARYDGFQMAVIGRFPNTWHQALYKLIKIMLIMRFVPDRIKRISRYPIPKPNKVNETRPISLCHDAYCFINGLMADLTSAAIEKCKILDDGIAAYRKGSGSANLVQAEISMREDVVQSGKTAMQLDEDEEKFFDRIPLVITLASMKTNGFPNQGYLEMKANCMGGNKTVEIFTEIGMIQSKFRCGLEQGNPDSPKVANLVIKNKHQAWKHGHLTGIISSDEEDGYTFQCTDPRDGEIKITSFGFCDDNTKFAAIKDKRILIDRTQEHVDVTGDLSIVTKIGRKGDKCEIIFFNFDLDDLHLIHPITSIAWSFSGDRPEVKEIPVRVFLANTERNNANRDLPQYAKYKHLLDNKPHKHLGVSLTVDGNTEKTGQDIIKKIKRRITELKIDKLEDLPQKLCVNMLLNTMHSYAPLQSGIMEQDLIDCDRLLVNKIRKSRGVGTSDSRHHLFLTKEYGGSEFRTFTDTHTISQARELEVIANSTALDGKTLRARIYGGRKELIGQEDKDITPMHNHAFRAIHKLAGLGILIRDRDDGLTNSVIAEIIAKKNISPIGHQKFQRSDNFLITGGSKRLKQTALGGQLAQLIRKYINNEATTKEERKGYNNIVKDIQTAIPRCRLQRRKNLLYLFKHTQTIYRDNNTIATTFEPSNHFHQILNDGKKYTNEEIWNELHEHSQMKLYQHIDEGKIFLQTIMNSKSPIIIATDGSHHPKLTNQVRTTGAISVSILDIREDETIEDMHWETRKVLPIFTRAMSLPLHIGTEASTITHGEACGFCLQEECLPSYIPRIVIMDSTAVRDVVLQSRDNINMTERHKIRKLYAGIGKSLTSRIDYHMQQLNKMIKATSMEKEELEYCIKELQLRNITFCKLATKWTKQQDSTSQSATNDYCDNFDSTETTIWRSDYSDIHSIRPIIKVDSHQLSEDGSTINKEKPRFAKLIPCYTLLYANHLADKAAEKEIIKTPTTIPLEQLHEPPNNLTYILTWNGCYIDKDVTEFLKDKINIERLERLRLKTTHGLAWRVIPHSIFPLHHICARSSWRRCIIGLTNSHSRSIYKNSEYRLGAQLQIAENQGKDIATERTKIMKGPAIPKDDTELTRCPWCQPAHAIISHKGNRRHALLHCSHPKLKTFRDHMNTSIDNKLSNLYKYIQTTTYKNAGDIIFKTATDELHKIYISNLGRLSKNNTSNQYCMTYEQWMEHFGINGSQIDIRTNKHILAYLLGFHGRDASDNTTDANSGVVENSYLGIIPKQLRNTILNTYNLIARKHWNETQSKNLTQTVLLKWKEIEETVKIRCIGLHRLCNLISQEAIIEWRKKFNIETSKNIKSIKPMKCKQGIKTAEISAMEKSKNVKYCQGITCLGSIISNKPMDAATKDIKRIKYMQKQCNRCSRHSTALRKTHDLLQCYVNSSDLTDKDIESAINELKLILIAKKPISTKKLFIIFNSIRMESFTTKNAKRKIADADTIVIKLLAKIFNLQLTTTLTAYELNPSCQCTTRDTPSTDCEQTIDHYCWVHSSTKFLANTSHCLNCGETEEVLTSHNCATNLNIATCHKCLMHEMAKKGISWCNQILKKNQSKVSVIEKFKKAIIVRNNTKTGKKNIIVKERSESTINTTTNAVKTEAIKTSKAREQKNSKEIIDLVLLQESGDYTPDSGRESLHRHICNTIKITGQPILHDAINMAIQTLRQYTPSNVYITNTSFIPIINRPKSDNWDQAKRLFHSGRASVKTDGYYLIPIFKGKGGPNTIGHFYLGVLYIESGIIKGHIFDSLGKAAEGSHNMQKDIISKVFCNGRQRIIWKTWLCEEQTELECGARTILAMATIVIGAQQRKSTEEIFTTLCTTPKVQNIYCSHQIRHFAAAIIQDTQDWQRMQHIPANWLLSGLQQFRTEDGAPMGKRRMTHRRRYAKKRKIIKTKPKNPK